MEEACRRLIAAGGLPGRPGQPTQIQLGIGLEQLRGEPGGGAAEAAWAAAMAGPGYDCDATIVPVVTGHLDARALGFPGCAQPPAACQPHHILPRSQGGRTCLTNLLLLCTFRHLIAVHRWDWGIVLLPDGTLTATSPDRTRTLHSHGPPSQAA